MQKSVEKEEESLKVKLQFIQVPTNCERGDFVYSMSELSKELT